MASLPAVNSDYPNLSAAFDHLRDGNLAVSVSVWRDHAKVFGKAFGLTADWHAINSDTPMVIASVSKLVTAITAARLATVGLLAVDGPVPWNAMGLAHDPAWDNVTVRELLNHTSGMPIAGKSWFDDPGSCATPLTAALSLPPRDTRGKWTYSNGNYCAIGLLIELVTAQRIDEAAESLVFDPLGISGAHLTLDPRPTTDGPYALNLARLDRLGGAGTWMISSDDVALMLSAITSDDLNTLTFPGVFVDQYGWGHTGTVDGAKACAWVIENGRTIVTALVAGNAPSSGGRLCDVVVPALALDLGLWADRPNRDP